MLFRRRLWMLFGFLFLQLWILIEFWLFEHLQLDRNPRATRMTRYSVSMTINILFIVPNNSILRFFSWELNQWALVTLNLNWTPLLLKLLILILLIRILISMLLLIVRALRWWRAFVFFTDLVDLIWSVWILFALQINHNTLIWLRVRELGAISRLQS